LSSCDSSDVWRISAGSITARCWMSVTTTS
jgi:hypothetical protein